MYAYRLSIWYATEYCSSGSDLWVMGHVIPGINNLLLVCIHIVSLTVLLEFYIDHIKQSQNKRFEYNVTSHYYSLNQRNLISTYLINHYRDVQIKF